MTNKQTRKPMEREILYQLMNFSNNRRILDKIPHIPYLDMAIVFYYWKEGGNPSGCACLVSEEDRKVWDYTLEELEEAAAYNTPRTLPMTFQTIEDLLKEMLEDEVLILPEEGRGKIPMYILTNEERLFGAAAILYPQVLWAVSQFFQEDLYVLPSSIHECIIVPASASCTREELEVIVKEVNHKCVPRGEILSNHAFFYQRDEDQLTL